MTTHVADAIESRARRHGVEREVERRQAERRSHVTPEAQENAEREIRYHEEAYTRLVTATEAKKAAAVLRLRQQGYTETNAKDFAQLDEEYASYKSDVGTAEVEQQEAKHATENARLRAKLAIRLVPEMRAV